MKRWMGVLFGWAVFSLAMVGSSFAELSSDDLLRILMEKGVITEADVEKAKGLQKEGEKVPEKKEGVAVEAGRKPKRLNIIGRVQGRFTSIEDGDLSKVTPQKPFDESEFDGFCLRRVRLRWFGEVIDRWKYEVQVSVDGDHNADRLNPATPDYELKKDDVGLMLQDAYFTYDRHPYFNVTVGQFKSRFSPSYLYTGPALPLCERPLVIDKLARRREIGISIESALMGQLDGRGLGVKVYDKPIFYAVGLYNGNGMNRMRNENGDFMPMAMVVFRPWSCVNFGVSYAYDDVSYDYETTVLGKAQKVYVDDTDYYVFGVKGGKVDERMSIWDFNSALDAGPVHLQVEYVQQNGEEIDRAYGYGIQGQYDLLNNFQLTARYDEYDPNVDVDNSFDSRWYTLGCNWFIHGQDIKWQANYTFREEMHGEDVDNDIFITHFQVLF